jgi:flavin reductase (DIM6/NTAB) family NADH-FMN oxidoreductase RutF/pimeloyl-ACP methyl ester carboxylesterase
MLETASAAHRDRDGRAVITAYTRRGSGTPLVLIHGVGMHAAFWRPQIDVLARHFDVIAIDMLGHGASSVPLPDASLSDYAAQILGLLDGLHISAAHLIGHSMGSLVALEFALSHPARTLSVVAMNAVFCRSPEQRAAIEARVAALDDLGAKDAKLDGTLARWFGAPIPDRCSAAAAVTRHMLAAVDPVGYARTYRVFAYGDTAHRDRLAALRAPALFLTGEHDPNSAPAMSHAMAALAPHAQVAIIPGERHMMSVTAPAAVNQAILAFLDAIPPRVAAAGSIAPASAAVPIPAFDPAEFRKAMGSFVTGVTVVATRQSDGQPRGFTANSFTSVSLNPPLVLICVSKAAASFPAFAAAGHFSVNVLADSQTGLSALFAGKSPDKFLHTPWRVGPTGSPLLDGCVAWFDCRQRQLVDAGDHIVLIGEVESFDHAAANPLGYYRGAHVTFGLSVDALAASGTRTQVGAILEHDGALLLLTGKDGLLDLPVGNALGAAATPGSLLGVMQHLGIQPQLSFLFAVFENPGRGPGAMSMYYRGVLDGAPAPECRGLFIPFDEVPWSRLRDPAVAAMLRRYIQERSEDAFGIYVGDAEAGTVQPLASPRFRQPEDSAS